MTWAGWDINIGETGDSTSPGDDGAPCQGMASSPYGQISLANGNGNGNECTAQTALRGDTDTQGLG